MKSFLSERYHHGRILGHKAQESRGAIVPRPAVTKKLNGLETVPGHELAPFANVLEERSGKGRMLRISNAETTLFLVVLNILVALSVHLTICFGSCVS